MKTVHEVSSLTGVSIRTLHYYDSIGLLLPSRVTKAGYRLYDNDALKRLQCIILFRELKFSLKEIADILNSKDFDYSLALKQQIHLLTLQKQRLENIIDFAREIQLTGVNNMDFSAFDKKKLDEYSTQAKLLWGNTKAYKEFEEKTKDKSDADFRDLGSGLMDIFRRIGEIKDTPIDNAESINLIKELQQYITDNFYTCTKPVLSGLGEIYRAGGAMTDNIDACGGRGTAEYTARVIDLYCE